MLNHWVTWLNGNEARLDINTYQYLKNNMEVNPMGLSNLASKIKYTLDKLGFSYAFYLYYINNTESLVEKIWKCKTDMMVVIYSHSNLHNYS